MPARGRSRSSERGSEEEDDDNHGRGSSTGSGSGSGSGSGPRPPRRNKQPEENLRALLGKRVSKLAAIPPRTLTSTIVARASVGSSSSSGSGSESSGRGDDEAASTHPPRKLSREVREDLRRREAVPNFKALAPMGSHQLPIAFPSDGEEDGDEGEEGEERKKGDGERQRRMQPTTTQQSTKRPGSPPNRASSGTPSRRSVTFADDGPSLLPSSSSSSSSASFSSAPRPILKLQKREEEEEKKEKAEEQKEEATTTAETTHSIPEAALRRRAHRTIAATAMSARTLPGWLTAEETSDEVEGEREGEKARVAAAVPLHPSPRPSTIRAILAALKARGMVSLPPVSSPATPLLSILLNAASLALALHQAAAAAATDTTSFLLLFLRLPWVPACLNALGSSISWVHARKVFADAAGIALRQKVGEDTTGRRRPPPPFPSQPHKRNSHSRAVAAAAYPYPWPEHLSVAPFGIGVTLEALTLFSVILSSLVTWTRTPLSLRAYPSALFLVLSAVSASFCADGVAYLRRRPSDAWRNGHGGMPSRFTCIPAESVRDERVASLSTLALPFLLWMGLLPRWSTPAIAFLFAAIVFSRHSFRAWYTCGWLAGTRAAHARALSASPIWTALSFVIAGASEYGAGSAPVFTWWPEEKERAVGRWFAPGAALIFLFSCIFAALAPVLIDGLARSMGLTPERAGEDEGGGEAGQGEGRRTRTRARWGWGDGEESDEDDSKIQWGGEGDREDAEDDDGFPSNGVNGLHRGRGRRPPLASFFPPPPSHRPCVEDAEVDPPIGKSMTAPPPPAGYLSTGAPAFPGALPLGGVGRPWPLGPAPPPFRPSYGRHLLLVPSPPAMPMPHDIIAEERPLQAAKEWGALLGWDLSTCLGVGVSSPAAISRGGSGGDSVPSPPSLPVCTRVAAICALTLLVAATITALAPGLISSDSLAALPYFFSVITVLGTSAHVLERVGELKEEGRG